MVEWKAYPQGEFGDGNAKQGMGATAVDLCFVHEFL
jgi:hypothetical protein